MTQPPGRTAHHDGDGCTGTPRTVDTDAADDIGYRARRIITRAAISDWADTAAHADWTALHYGPPGEFFLSALLAGYVRQGLRPRGNQHEPLPQLAILVPSGDLQAVSLFEHLASRRALPGSAFDHWHAIGSARLPLQTFMLALYVGDQRGAQEQWLELHEQGRNGSPLLPLAFSAQLTLWASRAMLGDRHEARATADLN